MEYFNQLVQNFFASPVTLAAAVTLVYSMILPAVWLTFCLWLNREHPRRRGILFITFLLGAVAVVLVLPIEGLVSGFFSNTTLLTILWVACEELLKFGVLLFIVAEESLLFNGPRDYAIVAITIGLGFAGFENVLYILHPALAQNFTLAASSGYMRFLGANLLHAVTLSMPGLALGLAYFKPRSQKIKYALIGIFMAVFLHSIFNILLLGNDKTQSLGAFIFLWIIACISTVLWIRISKMEESKFINDIWTDSFNENESFYNKLISRMNISINDTTPIRELFAKQTNVPITVNEYENFEKLCVFLQTSYELHLRNSGMRVAGSKEASLHIISDKVSAKAINSVFNLLKEKKQFAFLGKQKIEVLDFE